MLSIGRAVNQKLLILKIQGIELSRVVEFVLVGPTDQLIRLIITM